MRTLMSVLADRADEVGGKGSVIGIFQAVVAKRFPTALNGVLVLRFSLDDDEDAESDGLILDVRLIGVAYERLSSMKVAADVPPKSDLTPLRGVDVTLDLRSVLLPRPWGVPLRDLGEGRAGGGRAVGCVALRLKVADRPRRGDPATTVARMPTSVSALPMPGAVLFDLDGTLVDTVDTRIRAWERALEEAGLPTTRDRLAPLIGVDGKRLAREIAALAGRPIDEQRAEEIDRRSGEIYERLNRSPKPLPGVRPVVAAIEARGIPWAIATSSRKDQVATSVAALGLEDEPTIVDASNVKHAKPEPDLLLLAAKQLKVEPGRCWYVGDSTWDMVSAVAAAMIAIGVTAGSAVDARALAAAGASAVVRTLTELAEDLRRR